MIVWICDQLILIPSPVFGVLFERPDVLHEWMLGTSVIWRDVEDYFHPKPMAFADEVLEILICPILGSDGVKVYDVVTSPGAVIDL